MRITGPESKRELSHLRPLRGALHMRARTIRLCSGPERAEARRAWKLAYDRAWYKRNRERRKAYNAAWYAKNRERRIAYNKQWHAENMERHAWYWRQHRAKKKLLRDTTSP